MTTKHPQERIIKTFNYNGIEVDLITIRLFLSDMGWFSDA